jgi:creatinine amidohydrolase/Fe(II)-dependent formamide hydrolase-like protein
MPPLFPVLRRAPAPTVLSGALLALALMAPAASLAAQPGQRDPRSMGGGQCSANPYNCADAPNPLPAATTVWLEEMTWMDVRDALKAGKTTAIITTGGMEPNGPFLVTGKHNYVLRANCEAIAKALGNALCAPTIKFVPEGGIDPKTSHMTSPGTISLREATFRGLLTDVVHSLKQHGFTRVILIGDSGGNQGGQRAVADSLTAIWKGSPIVAHIPEYYDYASVSKHMEQFGLKDTKADGLHDDPVITLNMWTDDPRSVRLAERKKAGLATINGVSVADEKQNRKWADEIVAFRTRMTVEAIAKATAHGGTLPAPARRGSQE